MISVEHLTGMGVRGRQDEYYRGVMPLAAPRNLIYQVFVDRFAGPGGAQLPALPPSHQPWLHHAGGTLDGVAARLDHITGLGADALYLTPIFPAPSNHKYDTDSFDDIDPRFGGEAAWRTLVEACRARDLGVILDGVFNHVGEGHPWFAEARADAAGARAAWFKFRSHPTDYARWRGHGHLPELDLGHAPVAAALFDAEDAVLRRWLRRGATGFRLDCANDLGLEMCARAAAIGRAEAARDGVIGEVMAFAADWVARGRLDGVMNYWFRESILGVARGEVAPAQVQHNLDEMARRYRPEALLRSWNVLATHDTPRLATLVPDAAARSFARAMACASPGVPHCYYGEELGLLGGADPDNRGVMPWPGDGDAAGPEPAVAAELRALTALRRSHPALREGGYLGMPQPGAPSLIVFARITARAAETVLVVANASASATRARIFPTHSHLHDALPLRDLAGAAPEARMQSGSLTVTLAPWQVALYSPDDGSIPGYSFFR